MDFLLQREFRTILLMFCSEVVKHCYEVGKGCYVLLGFPALFKSLLSKGKTN